MVVFPGSIRWAIDGLLTDLSGAPGVSAIGLYGSWVRGDATDSSDLDLLVVDGSGVDYEWSETRDMEGFLVDLNHVPGVWVREPVNPVVDHKLHEAVVLHDPEVVLGSARGFVERNFRSPGRIEVRTDGFIAMSEMYLSRASGAVNRGDVETAAVYVGLGLVPAGYALMDVAGVPVTRRGFVWNLRRACMLMGVDEFYGGFISSCRLGRLGRSRVEGAVDGFRGAWEGVSRFMVENRRVLRGLHGKLRRDL
ncbi:MAG: nucleotidyltransferase domain-containing protein, partial [Candidatus Bathyarchaeota archaeon]